MGTMPIQHLMDRINKIKHRSPRCYYSNCKESPINSHTISKNYLPKLKPDLKKVLFFAPNIILLAFNKDYEPIIPVKQDDFSTFEGFCGAHDASLFKLLDEFNGEIDNKTAWEAHYRAICYGIHLIRTQIEISELIRTREYTEDTKNALSDANKKQIKLILNGAFQRRLQYCLKEHLKRKAILEKILDKKEFDQVKYFPMPGGNENPIFCGRSSRILHPKENFFKYSGYGYMPWITYMTLRSSTVNYLIFCWLESDKEYAKDLDKMLDGDMNKFREQTLPALAYGFSDAFALEEDFYNKHKETIRYIVKEGRIHKTEKEVIIPRVLS